MSRVHLGMKRPIRQFEKSYDEFKNLIESLEIFKPKNIDEKEYMIKKVKQTFNDCLIQLNNIKNTQIEYLEEEIKRLENIIENNLESKGE